MCYTKQETKHTQTFPHIDRPWDNRVFPPTLRQWSVSVFENILNLASSPMNRTVLFFVSMLIWSFFRIYSTDINNKIRVLLVCICRLCEHQHSKKIKEKDWKKKKHLFVPLHSTHVFDLKRITQQTQQQTTYMEPEVSLQHGAEVFSHVWHAGMKSCHQARVEGQKIQPGTEERVSTPLTCRPLIIMIAPPGGAWSFRINLSIFYIFLVGKEDLCCTALPLPGDSEEGSHKLPPVRFGVHVHAEVHGSLQESR